MAVFTNTRNAWVFINVINLNEQLYYSISKKISKILYLRTTIVFESIFFQMPYEYNIKIDLFCKLN